MPSKTSAWPANMKESPVQLENWYRNSALTSALSMGWVCTRVIVILFGYITIAVLLLAALFFGGLDNEQEIAWAVSVSPDRTQTAIGIDSGSGGAISPHFWGKVGIADGVVLRDDPDLGSKGKYLLFGTEGVGIYGLGWAGPGRLSIERAVQ